MKPFGPCACGLAFVVAACASSAGQRALLPQALPPESSGSGHIKHVIVMIQENRSFDDLFATFPGADGATTGKMSNGKTVPLQKADLVELCDFGHSYSGFVSDYDGGKMDGFDQEGGGMQCPGKVGRKPYQYVDPSQIQSYWSIAQQYVLADHMFQTQGSGSYTAHQDLIRGDTTIDQAQRESLIDYPSAMPWGCDGPSTATTALVVWTGSVLKHQQGPAPCTKDFPASGAYYATLRDLLDAKSVSWKYYSPSVKEKGKQKTGGPGSIWNAFDTIAAVRYGPEWETNVTRNEKLILKDISGGTLPAVSWLIPDRANSDHPGPGADAGPSWVAGVVNAVGQSQYWNSTAIVVVWDDWGGFYDNAKPPKFDHWGGLGFRVPMLVVSPYAKVGYVSHTRYEFGSILRFIEDTFGLGRLGTTDTRAASIAGCFNFTQKPRKFVAIPSKHSLEYFEHQRPSYLPVDTE